MNWSWNPALWSRLEWGFWIWYVRWIGLGFFVFELLPLVWAGCPWGTLTATTRGMVKVWFPFGILLMGTCIFLPTHLLFGRPVAQSLAFGLAVAVAAHLLDHALP